MGTFASITSKREDGQDWVALALLLEGMRVLEGDPGKSLAEIRKGELEGQMALLSGFAQLRPGAMLELRYLRYAKEPFRIVVCLLVRFPKSHYDIDGTGTFLLDVLRSYCPDHRFVPVAEEARLQRLLDPFTVEGIAELTRRDSIQRLDSPRERTVMEKGYGLPLDYHSRGRRPIAAKLDQGAQEGVAEDATIYLALPFLLSNDTRERLGAALLGAERGVCLSVVLRPYSLSHGEIAFMEDRVTRCEKYSQLFIHEPEESPYLRQQANNLLDSCVRELHQFEDSVYFLRARVASEGPLPEGLLAVAGSAFSTHSGFANEGYEKLESAVYSGGFRARRPADEAEALRMRAEFAQAACEPHAPSLAPPGLSSLLHLFDITEAVAAFRLPLPLPGGFPGLDTVAADREPAPTDIPGEGIIVGLSRSVGRGREIRIPLSDRLRHTYIVGQTGTGKSTLLSSMLLQDAVEGRGFALIDPHGELIDDIIERIPPTRLDDVIYLNPQDFEHPIPMNILRATTSLERDFVVNYLIEMFYSLYTYNTIGGPMFEMYMRNILMLLLCQPEGNTPSFLDIPDILQNKEFRSALLGTCTEPRVVRFWRNEAEEASGDLSLKNIVSYFTSKFSGFIYNETMRGMLARKESTIDYSKVMDEGKILLVDLRKGVLGATNAYFVGMFVIGEFLRASLGRTGRKSNGELPPFFLYIDEFQNVATPSLMNILSEARKYGLGVVLANQYLDQLKEEIQEALIGNVGTMVSFRVGKNDAQILAESFGGGMTISNLVAMPNFKAALRPLLRGTIHPAFTIETILPSLTRDPGMRERIVERSRRLYTLPQHLEIAKVAAKEDEEQDLEKELEKLFGD